MAALPAPWANPRLEDLVGRQDVSIPEVIGARAAASPDADFLWTERRVWSYREALDEIGRFAGLANALDLGARGGRVASYLPNRPEAIWTWLGTLAAGHTYVPLNRNHRGQLLREMLERSGAALLVTDREGIELIASPPSSLSTVLVADEDGGSVRAEDLEVFPWSALRAQAEAAFAEPDPAEVAIVMFTSGTTGSSKAASLTHNQCARGGAAVAWSAGIGRGDVFHCWWPLYHVSAMVDTTLPTVIGGGSVALYPRFSRSRFWEQVADCGATIFGGMANMLELLWALPPGEWDDGNTLRAGIVGYIPPGMREKFEQRYELRLFDTYGMTEAEPIAMPHPQDDCPPGSCGKPNPDFEVAILNERDESQPAGVDGEIAVRPRRPHVMFAGYEGDADATVTASRNLWFHTGDLGRMDEEGHLFFVDRLKDVIRRRGENISTWELERQVNQHDAVAECSAVGVPSALGEDEVKVVIVLEQEAELDPSELRLWCQQKMATFMCPRYIEFRHELPRNDTGKVKKQALRDVGPDAWDAETEGEEPEATTSASAATPSTRRRSGGEC